MRSVRRPVRFAARHAEVGRAPCLGKARDSNGAANKGERARQRSADHQAGRKLSPSSGIAPLMGTLRPLAVGFHRSTTPQTVRIVP